MLQYIQSLKTRNVRNAKTKSYRTHFWHQNQRKLIELNNLKTLIETKKPFFSLSITKETKFSIQQICGISQSQEMLDIHGASIA